MRKILVILDVQYLFSGASHIKKWIDLRQLVACIRAEYKDLVESQLEFRAYSLNDKDEPSAVDRILEGLGCAVSVRRVTARPSLAPNASHDVRITLDVVDRLDTMDRLVLVTGKANYTDLNQRCHMYKKEVHVWGFEWSVSKQLVASSDRVFHLDKQPNVLVESRR